VSPPGAPCRAGSGGSALSTAAALLRRKADEWRALGAEHCADDEPVRLIYLVLEATLREVAEALEVASTDVSRSGG